MTIPHLILKILVTKWSLFGHHAVGQRFSQAILSIDNFILGAIRESQLFLMGY